MCKILKGFIVCLICIFCFKITNKATAANAYFVWEKSVIDVPVFSNLEEYKDDYVVKLYVNGKESKDFTVTYEVNTSSFSTVLTNKVGRYTVYYKAYSKNNYVSSVEGIIFNVCDVTPPIINIKKEIITINYNEKIIDLNMISITDDTCDIKDVNVVVDDQNVIYNIIGIYDAMVIATDLYGNTSSRPFKIEIVDTIKPKIEVLQQLIFDYNEDLNIYDYFMCTDELNGDITRFLTIEGFDSTVLGKQTIRLSVADYSNNKVTMDLEIMVVDRTPPTLDLYTTELTLDILDFELYDLSFFESYIYRLIDNYTNKENISIEIDTGDFKEEVADYIITYTATDYCNNKTKKEILVKLRELVGPVILVDNPIYLEVGSDIDLSTYIAVTDEFDPYVSRNLNIEFGDFDMNQVGTYIVKVICFNSSGVFSEEEVEVIVTLDGNPSIETPDSNTKIPLKVILFIIALVVCVVAVVVTIILFSKKKKDKTRV